MLAVHIARRAARCPCAVQVPQTSPALTPLDEFETVARVRYTAAAALTLLATACLWLAATGASATSPEIGGAVSSRGVANIRWGATPAQVREWAGQPEFTGPPVRGYPIPAQAPGSLVLGYHCEGFDRHSCHTLFGFVNRRLTSFATESPSFHTSRGAHPGMKRARAQRVDPVLQIVPPDGQICRPPRPARNRRALLLAATLEQKNRLFTLYARSPAHVPAFPHC